MDQINAFLDVYGLAALFGLLLLKSLGVPIPIPNDLIMLSMAVRSAEGRLIAWQAFIAGLIALVLGGTIQFMAIRAVGRGPLYRYGRYVGLTPPRLDAAAAKVKQSSPVGIGLAIATPGLRSMVVTACGLSGLRLRTFASGQIVGSLLLLSLYFFLGYVGRFVLMRLGVVVPLATLIAVVGLGMGVWVIVRQRRRQIG